MVDQSTGRTLILSHEWRVSAVIGRSSTATVQIPWIIHPCDIAIDPEDRLLIADFQSEAIHILDNQMEFMGNITISHEGSGQPRRVAIDSRDRLLVADKRGLGESWILVFGWNESEPEAKSMVLEHSFQFNPPNETWAT